MICTRCRIPKDDEDFRLVKSHGKQHRRRHCKKCEYEIHTQWGRTHLAAVMCQSAKFRAKRDGVPFDITRTDIVIPDVCPVFGKPLVQGSRKDHEWAPTLDRIQPELGYVRGNIQVMSHKANWIKNNATISELKQLIEFLLARTILPVEAKIELRASVVT